MEALPLDFGDFNGLVENLRGAALCTTPIGIRFARGAVTYEVAVQNSRILIAAAVEAGVRRIVHISITNPSEDSPLPYFQGKALVEKAIQEPGLSYAILRPTVLFSPEDVLINNIAWFLRRFPAFPIAGSGDYPIQPVFVDDLAQLAVNAGAGSEEVVLDAVGPETFTFEEMVRLIARRVGSRARLIHVRPSVALLAARMAGWLVRDVVLTRDEIDGLMAGHLVSADPPPPPPGSPSGWRPKALRWDGATPRNWAATTAARKVAHEIGWEKRTPKSDKIERRRCQYERCPSRKIHEGIPPGSSEAGNGREAIIAGGSPPVVPGAIDVRVLGEGTKGRQTGRCRQDVQALD